MSVTYQHRPLEGAKRIRVLGMQPAPDLAAPISCKLTAVSLDHLPQRHANYTALSYTWDGQSPSHEVDCEGGSLLITLNCSNAIRELRSTTETKVLWIDSICIDQTPAAVKERNVQVALMGEIYKSAARVVVWLGPSNGPVEGALRQVMDIAMVTRSAPQSIENRRIIQQRLRDYVRNLSDNFRSSSDDPIGPLFECSWFYRMWTIQEVTLSAIQKTFLRCGSSEIPWPVLIIAVDALKSAQYKWCRWEEAMGLQKQLVTYLLVRRFPGSKAILDDNPGDKHNDPLVYAILTNTRKKLAGDEKDKIIALYGLFTELEIPFPVPDYTLPVEDIYRNATVAAIKYDRSLHILFHAPSDKRRRELSSWVPDWAEQGFAPGDGRYGVIRDRFAASGPGQPLFSFSDDNKILFLRGKIIDTVIYKTDSLPDAVSIALRLREGASPTDMRNLMNEQNHKANKVLRSWVEVSTWTEYPTGESSKSALQRTLVQDNPEENAKYTSDGSFEAWYSSMSLSDVELAAQGMARLDLREPHARNAHPSTQMGPTGPTTNAFQICASLFCSQKCFFYTEHNYFGTAPDPLPDPMQAGDVIALVSGLEMPLLLRPVDGGFRLITHVYVHGVMYGELWPEGGGQLEDIALL